LTRAISDGVAKISIPLAKAASGPLAEGQINPRPCSLAASAALSMPITPVTAASSDSSPSAI